MRREVWRQQTLGVGTTSSCGGPYPLQQSLGVDRSQQLCFPRSLTARRSLPLGLIRAAQAVLVGKPAGAVRNSSPEFSHA